MNFVARRPRTENCATNFVARARTRRRRVRRRPETRRSRRRRRPPPPPPPPPADAEMVSLRKESARWRAMYDALREDAGRGVSASEADALRLAVKHAEDRHRRELTLLGTEHGNAHASLRRSLADAERRWADLAPRLDRAERRAEAALAALAEETARREAAEAESARLRGDASRAGRGRRRRRRTTRAPPTRARTTR